MGVTGEGRSVWSDRRIVAGVSLVALLASYLVAAQVPVPQWEIDLTIWINSVPDWVATLLYPIMQLGTVIAPIGAAALIAVFRRDLLLAGATLVAGFVTWNLAKGVKKVVERGRPLEYVSDIIVREGNGLGFGYVSGHSAVAAVTAVVAGTALPLRWRPLAPILAFLVGVARIVHGVHLPADVVGGWAVGTFVGLLTLVVVEAIRPGEVVDG